MDELREIVKSLAKIEEKGAVGRSKRIRILQKLNEKLLSEYYIKINDNFIIEPLLVEAYYYHEGKFEDGNTHRQDNQRDRFGKLCFQDHNQCGGIDICLSCGNYYLSFLIKYSIVDRKDEKGKLFCSQQKLYDELCRIRKCDSSIENRCVLEKRSEKDKKIVFSTVRIGLEKAFKSSMEKEFGISPNLNCIDSLCKVISEKGLNIFPYISKLSFMYERLAAVKGFDLRDSNGNAYDIVSEDGYRKGKIAAEYIHEYVKYESMTGREIDYDGIVQKILGEGWKKSSIKSELDMFE